jgi:hypothetical protein
VKDREGSRRFRGSHQWAHDPRRPSMGRVMHPSLMGQGHMPPKAQPANPLGFPQRGVLGVPQGIRNLIPRVPNRPINRSETFSAVRSNQPALSPTFATMMHQSSKKRFNCSKLYFHLKHTDLAGISPETRRSLAGDSPEMSLKTDQKPHRGLSSK